MISLYDIIDKLATEEDKPHWWPCYWLHIKEYKEFEVFYYGGSVIIEARCTREAILLFEYNCPDLNWYSCGVVFVDNHEQLEDAPF